MSRQTGSDLIDRWEAVGALWDMTTEDCPNPGAAVGKCMEFIKAIPSAEPTWTSVLAELHERFDALEKELRRASAEMSAVIREYVDRPQGKWTKTDIATYRCSECGKIQIADDINELNFCCCCGSRNKIRRMKGADDERIYKNRNTF